METTQPTEQTHLPKKTVFFRCLIVLLVTLSFALVALSGSVYILLNGPSPRARAEAGEALVSHRATKWIAGLMLTPEELEQLGAADAAIRPDA